MKNNGAIDKNFFTKMISIKSSTNPMNKKKFGELCVFVVDFSWNHP
jgi:hypothetical protein